MTIKDTVATSEAELMLVVERLATQDKRRIVQLVELLCRAPVDVRKTNQNLLKQLLARESMTHADCQQGIESVLDGIERALVVRDEALPAREIVASAG